MPSVFSRIAAGEIPGHIVFDDDLVFAILDINPRAEGHTLVISKMEVDQLYDLPDEVHARMWSVAKTIGTALRAVTGCDRVFTFVIGDEVPHAHIHLIPSNLKGPLPFPPLDAEAADRLAETAQAIREALT